MTSSDISGLDKLNRKRRKIVLEFHRLRAQCPGSKKFALVQQVARALEYKLDQNRSNAYILKVLKQWGA